MNNVEQLMLELLNRARLDPLAEAARFGIDLNESLPAGTLNGSAKQVLAPNTLLDAAAQTHSQWMLDYNLFQHEGAGGNVPADRAAAAGYVQTGYLAENIALKGESGTVDLAAAIIEQHEGLFRSATHRSNLLFAAFEEVGLSQLSGVYDFPTATGGTMTLNSAMLSQVFAQYTPGVFVTGVIYNDSDSNDFYSVGEGQAGIGIAAQGSGSASTASGGYKLGLTPGNDVSVTLAGITVRADLMETGKLDLVNGDTVLSSVNLTLVSQVAAARLLGVGNLTLTGTGANDALTGNRGDNVLSGQGGHDRMFGGDGNDTLGGGDGSDTISGGIGDDVMYGGSSVTDLRDVVFGGDGNDSIDGGYGNDELRGDLGNDTVAGGFGADTVIGGAGDDVLTGSAYGDEITGGDGNDFINGGFGFDRVNGGNGADKFFHLGVRDHGSDWIQDYSSANGDVLLFGGPASTAASDFLIQRAFTPSAGAAGVQEVFVTQISTGNLLWALVDGDAQAQINIQIGANVFDLLA